MWGSEIGATRGFKTIPPRHRNIGPETKRHKQQQRLLGLEPAKQASHTQSGTLALTFVAVEYCWFEECSIDSIRAVGARSILNRCCGYKCTQKAENVGMQYSCLRMPHHLPARAL